jgi:hypothetical protein
MRDNRDVMASITIMISVFIALSCKSCWKITVTILSIGGFIKCIYCFCKTEHAVQDDIFPIQELNTIIPTDRRLSIDIGTTPDFSRLYTEEIVKSPLHVKTFCCSICLDESTDDIKTLLCGHLFHQSCIEEWFKQEESCPLCRDEFDSV